MRECLGDLWEQHEAGEWVCITTNGIIKSDGTAVMGAGVARQAADRFPDLPSKLAEYLQIHGNRVFMFPKYRVITFPTKHHWKDKSSIDLIKKSCRELMELLNTYPQHIPAVWLPRPGCKHGGLQWEEVKSAISPLLDSRVIVIDREGSHKVAA